MAILITVNTNINNASFDIEVPNDVVVSVILKDLAACISKIMHMQFDARNMALSSERLDIVLSLEATLEKQGIWNGDYIQLTYFQD